jgi:hypothetical protein
MKRESRIRNSEGPTPDPLSGGEGATIIVVGLLCLCLVSCAAGAPLEKPRLGGELFSDDFSGYPVGMLSAPIGTLNPAIQEYHYLAHRGVPLGPWGNAITYWDAWAVGEEEGKSYLEMHLGLENLRMIPKLYAPSFVTGDPEWGDYAVEVSMKPLSTDDFAGVVFRYHTNRHHYLFSLEGGKRARLAVRQADETEYRVIGWRVLGEAPFAYETTRYYRLRVENEGMKIRCFVDGRLLISAEDGELIRGKAGVSALVPARYQDFKVTAGREARQEMYYRTAKRESELHKLRAENPKPVVWKTFETPKFGCGRNVRFGDLDGDGRPEMLFAQIIAKVDSGNFIEASCLTAVTLDGKVLWQLGRPDPRNGLLTSDTPFQIHDLDGDGKSEVLLIKDFKLQVLEGATGKLRKSMFLPAVPEEYRKKQFELKERPHELNAGDSISFFDLSGKGRRSEILVKDRYRYFWVYDQDLKPLWSGTGQLGHFPYPFDSDGDGKEEVYIGYSQWSPDGTRKWGRDAELKDHQDGVAVGNFTGDPKAAPRAYYVGSDEGFLVFDMKGEVLKHARVGHTQNMTVAKLREDVPGLQIATINFWKNPGILTIFDADGNRVVQGEPVHHGSLLLPVNWRGDGREFLLLSGNVREGGMIDGHLRRVVMFPDDGHPDLAAAVMDLTGDARDEVILWDQERVWIYTQDRPFAGEKIYAPMRNPTYNESNYRAQVSLPGWKVVK